MSEPEKGAARRTGSPGARAALLRGGAGPMGDRRTKRKRTRSARERAAREDQDRR